MCMKLIDGRDDEVVRLFGVQQCFLKQHVLSWADVFAQKVAAHDAHGYYAAFAGAMAAFAYVDAAYSKELAAELSTE